MNADTSPIFLRREHTDPDSRISTLVIDIVNYIIPYLRTYQTVHTRNETRYVRCWRGDTQHGTMYVYNTITGRRCGEVPFVEGQQHGIARWTYPSGELKTVGEYAKGRQYGLWHTYWKNGAVKLKVLYENGVSTDAHEWDEDGAQKY